MAFTFVAFAYIVGLILTALLIFLAIWHIIAFDELKNDHKNPIEQCNSLNPLVIPEYATHIFINFLFLIGGEWITLMLNMPLIAYHINKYRTRPLRSGFGIYDPTSIMNAQVLSLAQREGWIKLEMNQDESRLRTILVTIEDRLSTDDRSKLCFQIGEDIPRCIREEIERNSRASMDTLWQELIDRGKISSTDVKYLIARLRVIGRIDLVRRLEQFAGEANASASSSIFTVHERPN